MPVTEQGLVDNVNGYTLGAKGEVVRFTGLLIDREGKVAKLLERGDPRPQRPDFRLDGQGRTLLPGLIDAHGHVAALGFQALTLDLTGTASLADAQAKLRAYAAAHPNAAWIRGGGWNQELWRLGRFPTAADLDAAERDRPVLLERVDGHAMLANSAALAAAGVTARTPNPPGGRIERDARGNPTGLFVDAARGLVESKARRRRCRASAIWRSPPRKTSCWRTASPPPATWARARRIGTASGDWVTPGGCGCASSPTRSGWSRCCRSRAAGRRRGSMADACGWWG